MQRFIEEQCLQYLKNSTKSGIYKKCYTFEKTYMYTAGSKINANRS